MNTLSARQMLKERWNWWEATADHTAEDATLDPQSNFNFRLAMQKLAALTRNEKRLALGTFGRCERCGAIIDDDRLETILDNEWHYCKACASRPVTTSVPQKSANRSNGYRNYSQPATQMAY
jgi:RNA polymerase-binding transcription factor DksA